LEQGEEVVTVTISLHHSSHEHRQPYPTLARPRGASPGTLVYTMLLHLPPGPRVRLHVAFHHEIGSRLHEHDSRPLAGAQEGHMGGVALLSQFVRHMLRVMFMSR